ncbi:MAG: ABC transporter permease [Lentisphaerae bacterium]|nr:ABC transporter permease [Lentisphaerota bacterium]
MIKYIFRRTFYSLWVIFGVLLLTFALFNVASGDPAAAVLGKNASVADVESFRRELGSDLPLFYGRFCTTSAFQEFNSSTAENIRLPRLLDTDNIVAVITRKSGKVQELPIADDAQYFVLEADRDDPVCSCKFFRVQKSPWNTQFSRALKELVSFRSTFPFVSFFNFGNTLMTKEPVSVVLKRGVGPSLMLMLPIFAGEIFFGIILALLAVSFAEMAVDRILLLSAVVTMSMSYLVAIIFGQWFLGYCLNIFPVWGYGGIECFILPVLIGIFCGIGSNLRFFRTVFVDELRKEYLRTARAKGAAEFTVFTRHLLRNSMVQIITRISAGLPFIFTGSLLLESFFGIPGLGFAGMEALYDSDIQMLKALVLFSAVLFVTMNLLTDIAYAWADPRIKLE